MLTLKQILEEALKKATNISEAGCLMLKVEFKSQEWNKLTGKIDKNDLYDNEDGEYGVEKEPHITILFGFKGSVKIEDVKNLFIDMSRINFTLTAVDIFPGGDNKPYDVVKFKVDSDDLHKLHKLCKDLPHELTFPDYKPHMTIAYVKAGEGKKYVKDLKKELKMYSDSLMYSFGGKGKNKVNWKLK